MKIAVMGAGGVGGYLGGRLAEAGEDVSFIARGAHLGAIKTNGLRILSPLGNATINPVKATSDPAEIAPVDVVLFCVKLYDGDLNRSTQHFIFERDGGCCDGWEISSRFHSSGEDGDLGPLAAGGNAELDRPRVWERVVVHSFPDIALWRGPSSATTAFAVGFDAVGT